jgi:hypothetical protein
LDEFDVVLGDDGDRLSGTTSSGGSTNSVDVVFGVGRDGVVDDDVDKGNIETTVKSRAKTT